MPEAFERFRAHRPMIRESPGVLGPAQMKTFERLVEITHRSLSSASIGGARNGSENEPWTTGCVKGC
jgi:hypothetical protein